MRKGRILIGGIAMVAVAGTLTFMNWEGDSAVPEYYPRVDQAESPEGNVWFLNMIRTGNPDGIIDPAYVQAGWDQAQMALANRTAPLGLTWAFEGPDNQGGRTRAIMVDKDSANVVWAGSVTGGLYRSTNHGDYWQPVASWNYVTGMNQAISSIAQSGNGTIYVGTGSSFSESTSGSEGSGSPGGGIWYTTDYGVNWTQVGGSSAWSPVNEIAADPNDPNKVWVGCNSGTSSIKVLDNGVISTTPGSPTISGTCVDMQVANDNGRTVVIYGYSLGGIRTYINTDAWGAGTFTQISGTTPGMLPQSGRTRYEYAIAPSNPYKIYAIASDASGTLENVHMSEDMGNTWFEIAPVATPTFGPLNGQGNYNCIISVNPNDEDMVFIGGLDTYKWERTPGAVVNTSSYELDGQWGQITFGGGGSGSGPLSIHVDQHEHTWGPDGVFYIGNDGGIFRSHDGGQTFISSNRGYNTFQPYNIAFSKEGYAMGGAQDNGTMVIDHSLTSPWEGYDVYGGDGYTCDISHINSDIWFASSQYGNFSRSEVGANPTLWAVSSPWDDPTDYLSDYIAGGAASQCGVPGSNLGDFYSLSRLAEWPNDVTGLDSLYVILDTINYDNIGVGSTINYTSQTSSIILSYTEQVGDNFSLGDTVVMHDPVQSWMAVDAGSCGVIVTRDALRMSVSPHWMKVAPSITDAKVFEWNQVTQDLYVGTWSGNVWRISGLDQVYSWVGDSIMSTMADADLYPGTVVTSVTRIFQGSVLYPITSISTDHNDPGRLLITRGGFSTGTHIYETTTADTDGTTSGVGSFTSKQGDLGTNIPVYSAVYDQGDVNNIVIGTEYGIFSSDNAGSTWSADQAFMGVAPVFDMRIQTWDYSEGATNPNVIYAGVHGRGIWSSNTIMDVNRPWEDIDDVADFNTNLNVFPNPMVENGSITFELAERGDVYIQVFDLAGNLVKQISQANMPEGSNTLEFSVEGFASGTYMVNFTSGDHTDVAKFVVR